MPVDFYPWCTVHYKLRIVWTDDWLLFSTLYLCIIWHVSRLEALSYMNSHPEQHAAYVKLGMGTNDVRCCKCFDRKTLVMK